MENTIEKKDLVRIIQEMQRQIKNLETKVLELTKIVQNVE